MVAVTSTVRSARQRQVVFLFDEMTPNSQSAAVRGGKGIHLAEMVALGLPVPPGFTITTTVARAFRETGLLPKRFYGQLARAMQRLEAQTGKRFGDPTNPLLVSVRSGAAASMPGMLDTVLNVGMTSSVVETLSQNMGEDFALDTLQRFTDQFNRNVLNCNEGDGMETPDSPKLQLQLAIDAVMRSWSSERAQVYRSANNFPEWWGTAVNVQAMVFGNLDDQSGTGVVFSHDLVTGQPGLSGEFLANAQGEDIVAGVRTPRPIADMAEWAPGAYERLVGHVETLAKHFGDIVDVEFTVESGELYLLQARRAKRAPRASVTYAVHQAWTGQQTREEAVKSVPRDVVSSLKIGSFDDVEIEMNCPRVIASGLAASAGAVVGEVALTSRRAIELSAEGKSVILVTRDTSPDDLPGMLRAAGLVTRTGGATCHAAVVARELCLPSVVGVSDLDLDSLTEGQVISVDGTRGFVVAASLAVTTPELTKEENIFLRWVDRFGYTPRIDFGSLSRVQTANELLNDVYLSDAIARTAVNTSHTAAARQLRDEIHQHTAETFAAYLLMAVVGEVQYALRQDRITPRSRSACSTLHAKFGVEDMSIPHEMARLAITEVLKDADLETQVEFFSLAERAFETGDWGTGRISIGGPKWAAIARTARLFLSGEMSPTVFVDHVFDLRHNGGVLFNKHSMLSRTDERSLRKQLDIKKATTSLKDLYIELSVYAHVSGPVQDMLSLVRPDIVLRHQRW